MKRFLSLFIIMILVLSLFNACVKKPVEETADTTKETETEAKTETKTETKETEAPEENLEDYTVQVLMSPTNVKNTMDTVVGQVIYDMFKINFKLIPYAGTSVKSKTLCLLQATIMKCSTCREQILLSTILKQEHFCH